LTWTQTDTLIPGGVTVVQVYRNGQILLPSQYTIPTSTSVVIAETSFKVNDNYTVIFPRGGGAGSGGGSGSLTSITAGTGIVVSPNPITTTGTVSADLTVMMELTDTTLLNLTTRFATKQNNITLTTTGTSGASTLVGSTLNIPQYTGGSGTVTSVGSGYGLLGGPITTTGTLTVDTSTVYDFVRDSIVAVEIGGDTIKIIKQEYIDVTNDTLVFTILPKFPIQLRQFILLFRNGQLLLNDQFSIIDTNKVKVAASSFKLGENYTLVTVSGIGSVSSGQGNPVYPEAGIALSTGTTWTTSITNNSSNWNTAFTDRLKWDGGSTGLVAATGRTSLGGTTIGQSMFTLTNPSAITFPRFNADNTVTARTAANFRSDIGAGTVTSVNIASGTPMSITNNTTTPEISMAAATGSVNGYLTSTDWTTFNGKQNTITLTTTGTSGAATLVGASLNIPQYTGGSGTVTNVSGTGAISVATGTTTPVISVATAAFGTAGIVSSSGTQQFSGDKVFEGISQFNGRALFKDYTYVATRLAGLSSTDRFATVTIGSGLSLSSGTLSATGGGVTSVTASSPLSSSGGATPNITITDAGAAASGVVNTTTQSFAGNKTFTGTLDVSSTGTFGGRVKTNWLERNYAYSTSSSFTVSVNTTWQDINTSVLTTITLPNAATYPGKELHLRQTGAGSVQSASSNIIPFLVAPTGSTSNGILIPAGNVRAATLVSDGDNWIIMQRNN
jgi:ABC-type Co2+ transport system permease subunit